MRQLSQSLAANLAVLDKMFGTSADYYAKEITIYHCRGSILLFDGMASLDSLWELLLDAASRQAPPQQAQIDPQQVGKAFAGAAQIALPGRLVYRAELQSLHREGNALCAAVQQ